jgi:hypothetical protein
MQKWQQLSALMRKGEGKKVRTLLQKILLQSEYIKYSTTMHDCMSYYSAAV